MALRIASIVLVLAAIVLGASYYYRYDLYEAGIGLERERAQLTEKQIEVNGMPIALLEGPEREGQQDVVLIHGFGANKDNWVRFAASLTNDFHVVAPDLPGHGESVQDPALDYDIDDQVKYLHAILQKLGIEQAHLAGNSMGGAVAALYSATYPQEVRSLLLIDSAGVYEHQSELMKRLEAGQENPLIVSQSNSFTDLMNFAMEKPPFVPWPVTTVLEEKAVARKAMNDQIFADLKGQHEYDFEQALTRIEAPTVVLWGDQDRVIHYKNADVFAQKIPNSRKVIYQGIGHVPMIEAPERTANLFRELADKATTAQTAQRQ
ncbi:alpha/beta hydrolase [Marinobacteraceae bacterium S3BR75-40.1]